MLAFFSNLESNLVSPINWLILLGFFLWIAAYALTIWKSAKDRSYGIPWAAICLNLGWELYFGFICANSPHPDLCPDTSQNWLIQIWFVLDCVIFTQMLIYKVRTIHHLKMAFAVAALLFLGFTFSMEPMFVYRNHDVGGLQLAWILNFVLNFLLIAMFFARRDLKGLSYWAAWAMFLGTAAMLPAILTLPFKEHNYLMYGLAVATVGTGALYVVLMTIRIVRLMHQDRMDGVPLTRGVPATLERI